MKKITLIVGSPRKNKSSNFLIEQAIEGIKSASDDLEIHNIQISDYKLTSYYGCDQCLRPPNECSLAKIDDALKLEDIIL